MSKGGGLWTIFSTKYCLLIGHKLWHVIKYWTLIGGEEKSFNFFPFFLIFTAKAGNLKISLFLC